jgi:uncharacterized membrane protein YjdF
VPSDVIIDKGIVRIRPAELILFFVVVLAALAYTSITPYDRLTSFMEVAPVVVGLPVHPGPL